MGATVLQTPLNEVQQFVLHTFAIAKSDREKEEITSLYLDYIQKKMDAETDRLWAEGKIDGEKIDEMLQAHSRTSYRP
jgi:hypothetical protein